MKFTLLPFMLAVIAAGHTVGLRLTEGFHVTYKATNRNLGHVTLEPWRQRAHAFAASVRLSALSAIAAAVMWFRARPALTAALLLLIVALVQPPHAEAFAGVAIIGQVNIDALKRDLVKASAEAGTLFEKHTKAAQAHTEDVPDASAPGGKRTIVGRLLTAEEKKEIQDKLDVAKALKQRIVEAESDASLGSAISELTQGMNVAAAPTPATAGAKGGGKVKSLGQQFIDSAAGQFFIKKQHRGSRTWASPIVELLGATLTTDAASGGDLIISDFRPGIMPLLFKRLTVRDLLAPGTTDSNSVTYMKEETFTNAAAAVAEGASKPESTLVFNQVTDLVQKIAHWLPVTEEMLEDAQQIRSYIDARLRLGVELTEEDQLLNGDGTPPNISGILDRSGLTADQARGADTNVDAIFKEMMKIFNASFVMPDAHVLNPTNWQTIQLSKDANGQYYGSGPFAGPQAPTLWGLPVAVTPSIAAGTALSGAYKSAAQIFDHGQLRVEASNSHSDYFIKNLVAIRAERRLALAVYRPAAFGRTTGLN